MPSQNDTQTPERYDQWSLVEIMGHQRLAGRVSETTIAGAAMLRVDVPEIEGTPEFTTFLGAQSIYRLTPVSEAIARHLAASFQARPVSAFELRALPAPAGAGAPIDDEDDDLDRYLDEDDEDD